MKNEIEKILDDTLESYSDEYENYNPIIGKAQAADKILSLFTNLLDSCEDEMRDYLRFDIEQYTETYNGFTFKDKGLETAAYDIIKIIKSKLEEK